MNNEKSLLEQMMVVPVRRVFVGIFLWVCLVAGLIYLMITV